MPQRKLQVVWPKDGFQGKSRTGFGSRLSDILKGKGPDMFIQLKGSRDAIRADRWGNWDSYHLPREHFVEQLSHNGLWNISRGMKRYDPETRTYKEWLWPLDWQGTGVGGFGTAGNGDGYPRFTRREPEHVRRQLKLGGPIDPRKVGPDWDDSGPKRFRQEHDWFWREAHRLGENRRTGAGFLNPRDPRINPLFRAARVEPDDWQNWVG